MRVPFHIVLYSPQIPQNTGSIGRLCMLNRARLHLIHPLGFSLEDKHLQRAGLDYWKFLDVAEWQSWDQFRAAADAPKRLWLFSSRGTKEPWRATFQLGDGLLFGSETLGCPAAVHTDVGDERTLKIPQVNPDPNARCLNLAMSAAVGAYEFTRQVHMQPLDS